MSRAVRAAFALACVLACGPREPQATEDPGLRAHAKVIREERVSENTVFLHRADGTTTAVVSAGPRAMRAEDGTWRSIRTDLQRVGARLTNTDNLIASELPAVLQPAAGARFTHPQTGAGLQWRPLWPTDAYGAEAELAAEVARYPLRGRLTGITDEFVVLRGGVKHNVHVPSRAHLAALAEGGDAVRIRGAVTLDAGVRLQPGMATPTRHGGFVTSGAIEVVGPAGTLFSLPAPDAFEVSGERRRVRGQYVWDPRAGVLSVEFPRAWFEAQDRTFPVVLDPPATTTAGYMTHLSAPTAAGPGDFRSGQDQVRLGAESFPDGDTDYYAIGMRFDLSAISPSAQVSAAGINVFYPSSPGAGTMGVHYERLSIDPEVGEFGALWNDLNHSASELYASIADTQSNTCNCWLGGAPSSTNLGTAFNATGVADLQAALSTGRFLVAMHATTYTLGTAAYPHSTRMANEPELRIDFTGAAPTVTGINPPANNASVARTVTVLGTNFQNGATATMRPVGGGANTALTVTYDAADRLQVTIPSGQAPGVYELQITTSGGASAYNSAGRYTVLRATSNWTGATSTAWSTGSNWSTGVVPDSATPVNLPATARDCITPSTAVTAYSVSVTGGVLRLGGLLTVTDELSHASGTVDMTAAGSILEIGGNAFFHPTNFLAGAGTVRFASTSRSRLGALGKVLFDDFEGGSNLTWTVASLGGSPHPWTLQDKAFNSPLRAYHQLGKQLNQGGSALVSPSFSLAGRSQATLRWRTRYRLNPEGGTGQQTSDGWAVQVSINGGSTWTTIAPHAASRGPHLPKVAPSASTACKVTTTGAIRVDNPVPAGPAGLFVGEQDAWIEDSVSLDAYLQPNVQVRFVSGWDNCNDYLPWEGVFIDDVSVEANTGALTLSSLQVTGSAHVTVMTPLTVTAGATVSSANATLDLNSRNFSASASLSNSGRLLRGSGGAFSVAGPLTNDGTLDLGAGDLTVGSLNNAGTVTARTGATTVNGALSTSGSLLLPSGAATVTGNLTVATGGTLRLTGPQLDVGGHVSNAGTFASGPALVRLSGGNASWTGSGGYQQARVREVPFSDGFESGALTVGGWTVPLHAQGEEPADVRVVPAPAGIGAGASVVNLHGTDNYITNWIAKAQSTAGKAGVWITFGWATGTDPTRNYELAVDYSLDGGGTWKTAQQFSGVQTTYKKEALNLSAIDPAVENNPAFAFRIRGSRCCINAPQYVDEVALEVGTPGMGPVVVAANAGAVKTFDPTASLPLTGDLDVASGTARIAAGKTVSLAPFSAVTSTVSAGAVLDVEPNATLALSSNVTLQVNGELELVGGATADTKAEITSTSPGAAPSRYALEVAGTLDASNFAVRYPNANGLRILAGATVLGLDDGAFHAPVANGALLTLASTALPAVAQRVRFENDLGVTGAVNVDGSGTTRVIDFRDAVGALEGEAFDLDNGTGANVTWSYTATQVVVSSATEPAPGNANAVTLTVELRDAAGHPATVHPDYTAVVNVTGAATVTGSPISIPNGTASRTITVTDTAVETVTVSLTETSATGLPRGTGTATFIAGPAALLAFGQQPTDEEAGVAIAPAITVRVTDSWGNLISGSTASVTMAFANNPAGGTLAGTVTRAASGGVATFDNLSINRAASGYTLRASAAGLTAAVSAPFSITPGAPAAIAFVQQPPASLTAGVALAPAVSAEVIDTLGNRTPYAAEVSVALASAPVGATLLGTTTVTAASGMATFGDLSLQKAGSGYTLRVTAGALTATSNTFQVVPAAADRVRFVAQPPSATAGVVLTPPVAVELLDGFDNRLASSANVTLAFEGAANGAVLGGTTTRAAASGLGSFNDLFIQRAGSYTLRASAAGVPTDAVSDPFEISPAADDHLAFIQPPVTTTAGASQPVSVEMLDAFGNRTRTTATVSVTIGANPSGGMLSGVTTTAISDGVATFSPLSLNRAGLGYTLVASAQGVADLVSPPFDVLAAPADRLVFRTAAPSLTAGACSGALVLELQDALGNVASASGELSVALSGLAAIFGDGACTSNATSATIASGGSSLSLSLREDRAGTYTLRATAPGLLPAELAITVNPGAPTAVAFVTAGHSVRAGLCSPEVRVQSVDALGNASALPAGGSWALSSDAGTLSFFADAACQTALTAVTISSASDAASFHFLDTRAGTPTVTVEAGALGTASQQQLIVPDPDGPPAIDRAVLTRAAVGLPYPYNPQGAIQAVGQRPMTFGSCGGPASLHVDAASGAVSWIPTAGGLTSLCVSATNALGEDRFTFEVDVAGLILFSSPVATFTVTPPEGVAPLSVAFDGSASGSELVSQRWDYGDGSPWEYGITSAWSYLVPGGYSSELRVLDDLGREGSDRQSVRVNTPGGVRPPLVRIASDDLTSGTDSLAVNLRAEVTPGDAPVRAWRWDLGDSVVHGDTLAQTFGPGRYRIRLVVTDENGLDASDWQEVVVTRDGQQPPRCRAVIDPPAGPAPLAVRHEAFSADLDGAVTTRTTTLADGSAQTAAAFSQTYAAPGRHRIAIRVVDDSGLACVDSAEVHALAATGAMPPKIVSRGANTAVCGVPYRYANDGRPTASGTGPFTWSVHPASGSDTLPTGLTIDEATGEVQWTPRSSEAGAHGIVLRVTSPVGFDEETLQLDLTCEGALEAQVGCGCGASAGGVWLPALLLLALRGFGRRRNQR